MANVLVLSLVFPPDNVSTAHIIGNLASDLKRAGHQVRVITTTPHYNRDLDAEGRQPLRRSLLPFVHRSEFDDIPVIHLSMPRKDKSVARRLISWCGFHLMSTIAAVISRPSPDVIICPSPPLTIGVSAWAIALCCRSRFIYNVQEIYPDIAINLGALRSTVLIGLARRLEHFVYRAATAITVIAPRMEIRLLERGVPQSKLHVIPNFVDINDFTPLPHENEFSREYELTGKFVVNYSGNVGPAQGLDILIQAANLLREDERIRFVIVGDGSEFASLSTQVRSLRLSNVLLLAYQPFSRMSAIYASAALCIVPQALATGSDAVPSKVYRIMACARAVLAVTDPSSDLAALIREAGGGMSVRPSAADLAALLKSAASDPGQWVAMGNRGRDYVRSHNTREAVTRQYDSLVRQLASV